MGERIEADVAVIGAGQAASPLVRALAKQGRRCVLIEREHLGGSCVNFGCTPSKAALASARLASQARGAAALGLRVPTVEVDFAAVMARARGVSADAREHLDTLYAGLDDPRLVRGHGRLWGREGDRFRIVVDREIEVLASQVVLDTGTRSAVPPIPGLDRLPLITAETWLDLTVLPERPALLGSGPIGLEMAQFYGRMGAQVSLIEHGPRIAPHEDEDVAQALHRALSDEGVVVLTGRTLERAEATTAGVRLHFKDGEALDFTHLFVAAGRQPNLEDVGLDSVGLAPEPGGTIKVDERLATAVPGLWAAGDIRGGLQFTQTSWDDHRVLLSQIAGDGARTTRRVVPYAVFTDPELGRVGLSEADAIKQGVPHKVTRYPFDRIARAKQDGRTAGFVKIVSDPAGERLLGAAVLGEGGGEAVHLFAMLMSAGLGLSAMREALFAHPTLSEGLQSAAAEAA